jgi:hypothetical protein
MRRPNASKGESLHGTDPNRSDSSNPMQSPSLDVDAALQLSSHRIISLSLLQLAATIPWRIAWNTVLEPLPNIELVSFRAARVNSDAN